MRPAVPGWAAQILGLPGAVSFRRYLPIVRDANALEERMRALDDDALRSEAAALQFRTGEKGLQRESTARYLAVAREAAARVLGLRAFDEQLLGCCALLSGHAVEMDTGEGKTLVGALAAAGFAVAGRRVHVISVNDYLAERDATWMGPFFDLLGVSVGWIGQHTPHNARRTAYECDVVYAPVSEIGFDVLRDRFTVTSDERVAPVFDVAIVDEADAVMIDEAMVPLVLAGSSEHEADEFDHATALVEALVPDEDFTVDADQATVSLTDDGLDRLEAKLGGINLYDVEHLGMFTRINLALHARVLVHRDVDYLVTDGKITLINTTRGRVAHLQRWPDGLHAALEAKEHLPVSAPGVILDQITIQDLLLQYDTRAGMSGTITAVAEELIEFYRLPAGRVERHEPNRRIDEPDTIVLAEEAKTAAVISDVTTRHQTGQPVLVGTQSVAESEALAARLYATGVPVRVLNAKNDAEEAEIVARASEYGAVTISTQMSGRGTDIRLGGLDGRDRDRVVKAGGLAVIATSRYPSRRLDAQLRGRAGRQGDPGVSRTWLCQAEVAQGCRSELAHVSLLSNSESMLYAFRYGKLKPAAEHPRGGSGPYRTGPGSSGSASWVRIDLRRALQHRLRRFCRGAGAAADNPPVRDHRRRARAHRSDGLVAASAGVVAQRLLSSAGAVGHVCNARPTPGLDVLGVGDARAVGRAHRR